MTTKQLSIFIPFYNEENNLRITVEIVHEVISKCLGKYEIILVNDGSTDNSQYIAKSLSEKIKCIKLINNEVNAGFGKSYQRGFEAASLPFAMYLCADGDVTKAELEDLLMFWDGKSALIQFCSNASERSLHRYFLSWLYTKMLTFLTKMNLPYFNGFNIIPKRINPFTAVDYGFSSQAFLLINSLNAQDAIQYFGMQCQYNDENSKALTLKNLKTSFRFFLYLINKRL